MLFVTRLTSQILILLLIGCASVRVDPKSDSWWSEPLEGRPCRDSSLPRFHEVRRGALRDALIRLADAPFVALTAGEAASLVRSASLQTSSSSPQLFLVRALSLVPLDGSFTVTLSCGTLFVGNTAPPNDNHYSFRRSALVVELTAAPDHLVVNCGEGIP
jgi:hypothetical protein